MVSLLLELHGTTFDNEKGMMSGWSDVRLSPKGLDEAAQLGARYAGGQQVDAVFYSDLKRAEQTATVAFELNPHKLLADWRLRECDYGDMTGAPQETVLPAAAQHVSEPFTGGESFERCTKRVYSLLMDLKDNWDGKTVLLVGHPTTLHALQYILNQTPLEQSVVQAVAWQPGWKFELQ